MQHTERIVGALLEAHPRPALDRLLTFLVRQNAARGALVCCLDGDVPVVEMVRTMRADGIARFNELWAEHRAQLLVGEVVQGEGFVLAPLRLKQGLLGGFYLDAPTRYDGEGLDYYLFALATGLAAAQKDTGEGGTAGVHVDQRSMLLLLLERHEWNISRVAREMGVTRRTVYLRMVKNKIGRRHVPKTLKALP